MAIDHSTHDHPATPAGRAACRKTIGIATEHSIEDPFTGQATVTVLLGVEPRRRKSTKGGIPAGFVRGQSKLDPVQRAARRFTIKDEGDLAAEVPHMFTTAIRHAWEKGWTVKSGHPYNNTEKRIVITSVHGELALVYRAGQSGVNGVFWRATGAVNTRRLTVGPVIANGITKLDRGDRVEDPE